MTDEFTNPPFTHVTKYGKNTVTGNKIYSDTIRIDDYTPTGSNYTQKVTVHCLDADDRSQPVSRDPEDFFYREYDPKCNYCWLNIHHTVLAHDGRQPYNNTPF